MNVYFNMIDALTQTADRLERGAVYNWSHQGNCNCGHLAQTITTLSQAEIHTRALEKAGDWREKVIEYCPTSCYPIEHIISTILEAGFSLADLAHLERLSSPEILQSIPPERKPLRHNVKQDVVLYMRAWVRLLEARILQAIELPEQLHNPNTIFAGNGR